MRFLRYLAHLMLTIALVVVGLLNFPHHAVREALAAFNASPQAWTASFELDPTATDPVSQGDDHLRQIKTEVRDRAETEHQWGSGIGLVTTDTGRHLFGSARTFVQNTAPPVDGSITANCLTEADRDGNRGCDAGRLWIDADGPDNVAGNGDDNQLNVCADTDADLDCDAWQFVTLVSSVPKGALIMWDQSNTCPNGYSEATEFRTIGVRGADRAGAGTLIPDSAGVSCTGGSVTAGAGNCDANGAGVVARYNDTQENVEMAQHAHTVGPVSGGSGLGTGPFFQGAISNGSYTLTVGTGSTSIFPVTSPLEQSAPFRTVLFCRKG